MKYNAIFKRAISKYKRGMEVISPMTGKRFIVESITKCYHEKWIKGFDGEFFFDVIWFKGTWARKV